jgi:DNA repair protein RadC
MIISEKKKSVCSSGELADIMRAILNAEHESDQSREPSQEDILLTKRLVRAGEILGIRVLDHMIIGDKSNHFSFGDNRLLNTNI